MSRQIVAIDIRNDCVATVVINTGLKGNTIEACGYAHLPPADGADDNRLAQGLTPLLASLDAVNASLVISLPADQTLYRTIKVPFKEEKKIRQVLPFELEPTLPLDVSRLVIDFQKSDTPETGLLVAAVDGHGLASYMDQLAPVAGKPQMVLPGDYPLALALSTYDHHIPSQALLLSIGDAKATLFAIEKRRIALARTLQAETATEAGVEALALKIRQTMTAYADGRPGGFAPERLYLSGPDLVDEGARDMLAEALALPAEAVDLKALLPKWETAGTVTEWSPPCHDAALAMAVIEVESLACPNFHRTGSTLKNYWRTYQPYVRGPAIMLALVLLLGLGGVWAEGSMLKSRVTQINGQIEALFAATLPGAKRIKHIDPLDQMTSEVKKLKGGSIDAGHAIPKVRAIDVLQQISRLIPKTVSVELDRLVMGSDGITISGDAPGFNVVDDIKSRLEQSDLFKTVTIASSNKDKTGNNVRFKLKIEP
ncbi:MAG: hypothetical protein HKP58_13535 [Desulfatitalea sp.]|nr:PilN domain-containing protein [Desulfatitalea sp.]NNK01423.1 hypothetical protein [Desulfatitalea sp.]